MPKKTGMEILPFENWFSNSINTPFLIAGPCSAESSDQVMKTARAIDKLNKVTLFRAGIWKPRTRPDNFSGVGVTGLKWLGQVKKETSLKTIVEVAVPKHVEQCLVHKIDAVWIGARTTSNPFAVQELSEALSGTDLPVFVKNPINPDISLWIGAIERFLKAGLKKIAGIHRGFFPFETTSLRNIPKWEIPIELKRNFHELPILCDPSHISGNVNYIKKISQKALDLNMAGLMIEAHVDPSSALSDSEQQLTPHALEELISKLVIRKSSSSDVGFMSLLDKLRNQIDSIDQQYLELLAQRMEIVEKIGSYKKENNVAIFQLDRWEEIIATRIDLAEKIGLDKEFVLNFLKFVHKESIQIQTKVMGNNNEKTNSNL